MRLRLIQVSLLFVIVFLLSASQVMADDKVHIHSKDSKEKKIDSKNTGKQKIYTPPIQFHLKYSYEDQPSCCKIWDSMLLEYKMDNDLIHFHGEMGVMAGIPVFTLTNPNPTGYQEESEHCKKLPCFQEGDPRIKEGKAQACACGRKCDEEGDITGCKVTCCPKKCGCAECPEEFDLKDSYLDIDY